jgi:hypothetical protein
MALLAAVASLGLGNAHAAANREPNRTTVLPNCVFQKFWTAVSQNRGQAFR